MKKVDRRRARYLAIDPGAKHTGLAYTTLCGQPFCHTINHNGTSPEDRMLAIREIRKLVDFKATRAVIVEDFTVRIGGAVGQNASSPLKLIGWLEALIEPSKVILVVRHPKTRVMPKDLLDCWPVVTNHDKAAAGHLQAWLSTFHYANLEEVKTYGNNKLW